MNEYNQAILRHARKEYKRAKKGLKKLNKQRKGFWDKLWWYLR